MGAQRCEGLVDVRYGRFAVALSDVGGGGEGAFETTDEDGMMSFVTARLMGGLDATSLSLLLLS